MSVKILLGPMFSGKSSKIIDTRSENDCVINHIIDRRYGTSDLVSHDGKRTNCYRLDKLTDFIIPTYCKRLFIDEAQFFNDIQEFILKNRHVDIVIVGLSSDYQGNMFPNITKIIPFAESVEFLTGICSCGKVARFTGRTGRSEETILVGAKELYTPQCISCKWDKPE
jgi:thymidine kinase